MWIFDTSRDKKLYHTALLLMRIVVGIFMFTHGLKKYMMLFSGELIQFPDPLGVGSTTSLVLTVFAEVVCSALIFIGLGTRLVVLPLIFTMFVIVFVVHGADGFGNQELPAVYLLIYLVLLVTGSGKYSIDHLISRKRSKVTY
ncbi:DoxX family protein [Flavobacterium cerinum]|uniref:DoxX family protein n=1 Tax=Flavobacterium cerinum TaxID=2502784 RepID=A0A3S3QAE7_9FLAO|nr:DoxX family protein [Flavobacterium cerinum]RWX02543.1 DoxX family protein [Flavobacterium cerinum]